MNSENLPTISVLMPTLNRERIIEKSLKSIREQNYPQNKIEIIIADSGSTDKTIQVAKQFKVKVVPNPLVTGEAGKAVALRQATGELVAFIDSDNVLPTKNWLLRMIQPFDDPEIVGSEPIAFTYRRKDGFIDRYCALLGMNDPYCLFLGVYDRFSYLTGKWTGLSIKNEDKGRYLKLKLTKAKLPTIGANGTFFRRSFLEKVKTGDYFFDIDILSQILDRKKILYFAKVKNDIIHLYAGSSLKIFAKKQERRIRDLRFYQRLITRRYDWNSINRFGVLKFIIPTVLTLPLIIQSLVGFVRKRDVAWFFHPIACWLTLIIYSFFSLRNLFIKDDSRDWFK